MTDDVQRESVQTTRTALDVLDKDQDRLLYLGDEGREPPYKPLRNGFDTQRELVEWYQAAIVRTLGHLDRVLPPVLITGDSALHDALVVDGADTEAKQFLRQRLVERLNRVCDVAYKDLRSRAKERVPDEEQREGGEKPYAAVDPTMERHPMQRPAFSVLDDSQAKVLKKLLDGFDDRTALSRWVRGVKAACNGEQPEALMDHIASEKILLEAMQGEFVSPVASKQVRMKFAVSVLFPAFLRAARTLRGSERAERRKDPNPWNEVHE